MHSVVLVIPFFSEFAVRVLRSACAMTDVRLGLISQQPQEDLDADLRAGITAHWRVEDALNADQLVHATCRLADALGRVERLFGPAEQVQVPVAMARERLGIEGMSVDAARNFRDKARMKSALRAAGLPCARHCLAASDAEAYRFADQMGFPVVAKPPDGAAAQSTSRIEDSATLAALLRDYQPSPQQPLMLEEFVTGDEHSFDTFSLRGQHLFHSVTDYIPSPLEVVRNAWIQWTVLLPREVDDARYDAIRAVAVPALDVLGMRTGLSHLEWFERRDGSVVISEVAARPPGAQFTTLISRANDCDAVQAWLRLMIAGEFSVPQRKYAAGCAYLRGQGSGKVRSVHGLELVGREYGTLITDAKVPPAGQPASSTYEGEGYVVVRHPNTEVVREALKGIVSTVRIELV